MRASAWYAVRLHLLAALLVGVGTGGRPTAAPPSRPAHAVVLLVSLDGFRWDYLDRGLTPTLSRLASEGVRAEAMIPVFPTKTFPNHFSMVTGRYPAGHGIVGNRFTAPDLGARFAPGDRRAVRDARFWLAEPIWIAAERQGRLTAPLFWPGSEAPIGGLRPSYVLPFDDRMPDDARVDRLLEWLDQPPGLRPAFLTLYISAVDDAGHAHGPDSPETAAAIAHADSVLGRLVSELAARSLSDSVNVVVVSDHGMIATGPERVIWLDDYVAREAMTVDELSPVLTAWPDPGLEDSVYRALRRVAHLSSYRRRELPARYRLGESRRVAPIVAIADPGWTMGWRRGTPAGAMASRGGHGYDDSLSAMRAIFVAQGPAFRRGVVVPPFRNIHVYPLLAEVLGLRPAPNDGSLDSVRAMLATTAR